MKYLLLLLVIGTGLSAQNKKAAEDIGKAISIEPGNLYYKAALNQVSGK